MSSLTLIAVKIQEIRPKCKHKRIRNSQFLTKVHHLFSELMAFLETFRDLNPPQPWIVVLPLSHATSNSYTALLKSYSSEGVKGYLYYCTYLYNLISVGKTN